MVISLGERLQRFDLVAGIFWTALDRAPRVSGAKDKFMSDSDNLLRNILIGGALTALLAVVLIKLGWE